MDQSAQNTAVLPEPATDSSASAEQGAKAAHSLGAFDLPSGVTGVESEANSVSSTRAMIVLLACAAVFSLALVFYVVVPALQTLVSPTATEWNPVP